MSGGGAVALGSSVTLTNAGVTSVAAGTGISVSASTGGITITNTSPGGGGVTSAVAGNGVAVSGATGAVTFSASCPTFNSVGSYTFAIINFWTGTTISPGSNYAAGNGSNQVQWLEYATQSAVNSLSGTWKWMGATFNFPSICGTPRGLWCRVA